MEQALVLASIVLGVAIAFELEHLNKVLRAKNVKWHWAQPAFALFVLLSMISFWWGTAADVQGSITLGRFLPIMFQLIMLALMAAVSFPDSIPDEGLDLAEYYQENRRYQWILMSLYFWSITIGFGYRTAQTSESLIEFFQVVGPNSLVGLLMIAMMFVRRWWQVALGFAVLSLGPASWIFRVLG